MSDYLYTKHRPATYDDMIGNKETLVALKYKVSDPNRSPGYLFSGPRGTGKSVSAAIFGEQIGAETTVVNSSDKTSIDDYRAIFDRLKKGVFGNKVRLTIFEEIHKLSNSAQNYLLDELHNPPNDCYFIATSTEPGKILTALRSRLIKYEFAPAPTSEVVALLSDIVKKEKRQVSRKVLGKISVTCKNHPRDCITALEALIDIEGEEAQLALINASEEQSDVQKELIRALLYSKPWGAITGLIKKAVKNNAEDFRMACTSYMNRVLLDHSNSAKILSQAANIAHVMRAPFPDNRQIHVTLAAYTCSLKRG